MAHGSSLIAVRPSVCTAYGTVRA